MKWRTLISELKRRHVFKSTIAYLAISWIIIQIASTILPAFDAPEYALKALIYVLAVGLIFWIAFSWVYDLTAEGIQKTDDLPDDQETLELTNKRLNKVIAASVGFSVLLLVIASFWAGSIWNSDSPKMDVKKVAVIPLEYQTNDLEEEYLKTGMTEALIAELSKVDQLAVISQRSTEVISAGFQSKTSLMSNVIKGIDYFVQGSITRESNALTVHMELKESLNGKVLWEKRYSKDFSEVRSLWAEVASDLTRQMRIVVKSEDKVLWSGLRSVRPETYELYLKGKHYMNKSTPEDWQRGMVYLQEALDKNPADPHAYAFLAEAYINLGHGPDPPPDVFPKALAAAQRAIQLDSTVALGWAALSHYHTYFGKDWALAEYAFKRANELNPNLADNHYHRAWYLALFGRMNEAIEEHKLAQDLDPFVPLHTAWLGELYRWVGLYDEGLAETEKAAQMENDYALSMLVKGRILMDQGKVEEGLDILKNASLINPGFKYVGYGPALINCGKVEEGRAIVNELESLPLNGFRALFLASMYAGLDEFDKAFEYLKYEQKHGWYPWIRVIFFSDEFRKDPRFLKLIRDMNLPDPAPLVYHP